MDNLTELFDLIGVLCRRRYQAAERFFPGLGLNHTEARLLTLLDKEKGEAAQDALSNMLSVDRSNAGRGLKRLEKRGLVSKSTNENDKRTKRVRLTAEGRKAVAEISTLRKQMVQDFFGDLTESGAGQVLATLREALREENR